MDGSDAAPNDRFGVYVDIGGAYAIVGADLKDGGTGAAYVFSIDTVAPTVTINQAPTQPDPTNVAPIHFTVVFSEPVDDFGEKDVTRSGTGQCALVADVSPAGTAATTYDVAVSGLTGCCGAITANIAKGVAHDAAGNPNKASTSSDNQISYLPWQNVANPYDVNDNKKVAASDALTVINWLNRWGSRCLTDPPPGFQPPPYSDVNGDCCVTARDALAIITYLNRQASGGEGESPTVLPSGVASMSADTRDASMSGGIVFGAAVSPTGIRAESALTTRSHVAVGSRESANAFRKHAVRDEYFATHSLTGSQLLQRQRQVRRANASGSARLDSDLEDVVSQFAGDVERVWRQSA